MPNPAGRLLTLLLLMQKQPKQKASILAEKIGVSERTIHRYIGMLEDMGIPLYSERGRYGGFSIIPGYTLPPLMFSAEEATVLYLGAAMVNGIWGEVYQQETTSVLAKLENVLPPELHQEAVSANNSYRASNMNRADCKQITPILKQLKEYIQNKQCCFINYEGKETYSAKRKIDFYTLIHRYGWWYALGFCHLRKEIRSFRVDRIKKVSSDKEVFTIQDGFNLKEYLEKEKSVRPKISCLFHFRKEAKQVMLFERSFWKNISPQKDGSFLVEFDTVDPDWAYRNALSHISEMNILEPVWLKEKVNKAVHTAYEQIKEKI